MSTMTFVVGAGPRDLGRQKGDIVRKCVSVVAMQGLSLQSQVRGDGLAEGARRGT